MKTNTIKHTNNLTKKLNYLLNKSFTKLSSKTYYERLEITNFIINSIKKINCPKLYEELKYRLEDDENINSIILNLMERNVELETSLYTVKYYLELFEYEDEFKKYFI